MIERIDGGFAAGGFNPAAANGSDAAARGSSRGETVTVTRNAASLVADAAEEMTFAASEKTESKKISERKVGRDGMDDGLDALRAAELLATLPDGPTGEQLKDLLQRVLELKGFSGFGLRELVERQHRDPSHQFAALAFLEEQIAGNPDAPPPLRDAVAAARATLLAEKGPAIRAGLNVSERAAASSDGSADGIQELRGLYRDTVLGFEGLGPTYAAIAERHPGEDFARVTDFLIKAAGDDLASRGPSLEGGALKAIVDDLYQLEVLVTVHREAGEMIGRLDRQFGVLRGQSAESLMKTVVDLTAERWITADRIDRVVTGFGAHEPDARINTLREFKELVRGVPLKVFADAEIRGKLLDAIQESMDRAIGDEE